MPLVAAVLTLAPGPAGEGLRARLATDPALSLGPPTGFRLPLVSDRSSLAEDRGFWRDLRDQPGLVHLEFVLTADLPDDPASPLEVNDDP